MRLSICFWLLLCSVLALPQIGLACLWDDDTLRDERRGMPGIAEILAGKWEKHSSYFYEQRVNAMKQRIASHPNDFDAYDNLAVAHEKLGDPVAAIAVMLEKEKLQPSAYPHTRTSARSIFTRATSSTASRTSARRSRSTLMHTSGGKSISCR